MHLYAFYFYYSVISVTVLKTETDVTAHLFTESGTGVSF